jgi:hypothetical protein
MCRYWIASLLTVIVLAAAVPSAHAIGDHQPPFACYPGRIMAPWGSVDVAGPMFRPVPTIQAAPWYLYWPYDGHFQTPAPVSAPPQLPPGYTLPYNPYNPGYTIPQQNPLYHGFQTGGYGH